MYCMAAQYLRNPLAPEEDNGEKDVVEAGTSSVTPTVADWRNMVQKLHSLFTLRILQKVCMGLECTILNILWLATYSGQWCK